MIALKSANVKAECTAFIPLQLSTGNILHQKRKLSNDLTLPVCPHRRAAAQILAERLPELPLPMQL
jgi:hypothetical protein